MKIGKEEINEGIYWAAQKKLQHSLEKEGFETTLGNESDLYDIYAEKEDDRRVYVIRIGKNRIQQRILKRIKESAKEKNVKLFVTYLEQPRINRIEYEGIEDLLFDYLMNNIPDEIDVLSTHTMLKNISDLEIDSICIKNKEIKVEGNAFLEVELLYGSERDRESGYGDSFNDTFEFGYRASIVDDQIEHAYFRFDVEHFYE